MKAFFLSGIGADHRMFNHLHLPDSFTIVHIPWQLPLQEESLRDYSCRLFERHATTDPFILIGISFGGMVAVEIANKFKPLMTIIISSIPTSEQLPKIYQVAGRLRLHVILHPRVFKYMTIVKQQILMKSESNKLLIRQITLEGDDKVIKWGMHAVLNWSNTELPKKLVHIHGSRDSVFPISNSSPTFTVSGGHMLTLENSREINLILKEILDDEEFLLSAG